MQDIKLDSLVLVRNEYEGSVSYNTGRYNRKWTNPGEVARVRVSELEEVISTRVGSKLFGSRKLVIEDPKVEEFLGIEPRDEEYDLYRDEIIELLTSGDVEKIEDLLKFCSDTTLQKVERLTVVNSDKIDNHIRFLVGDYSGRNINEIIEGMQPIKEDSEEEATPKRKPAGQKVGRQPRQRRGF